MTENKPQSTPEPLNEGLIKRINDAQFKLTVCMKEVQPSFTKKDLQILLNDCKAALQSQAVAPITPEEAVSEDIEAAIAYAVEEGEEVYINTEGDLDRALHAACISLVSDLSNFQQPAPIRPDNEELRKALEIVKNNYPFMRFEDQDRSFYVYDIIKKALQQPAPSADGREE